MSEYSTNVPKIRFPGFTDAWEQRKLGELVNRVVRKNTDNECTLPLTISAQYGLVDQITYFNKRVASGDVSNYYLVLNGEFAYNKSTSDGYPFGAVKRLDLYEKGVLSTLYIVFGIRDCKEINSDFLTVFFDTNRWHKGVSERAAEGARNHGLLNISVEDFFDIDIWIPKGEAEQAAIGAHFKQLDHFITLHQRKLNHLQDEKKRLLQKMFPKNGMDVPEIRFPGFTDAWEQRMLGELANFSKGSGYSKGDLVENGAPIILYGRLYVNYETVINEVDTFVEIKDKSVISEGNEVIVPSSGETSEDISRASVVGKSGIILGGDLNIIKPKREINPVFLALTISNGEQQKEMSKRAQGKSVVHLHNSDLKQVSLLYPKVEEQQKIEKFFIQLDQLITLHQRKIYHLQEQKKSLLQQMFV